MVQTQDQPIVGLDYCMRRFNGVNGVRREGQGKQMKELNGVKKVNELSGMNIIEYFIKCSCANK